MVGLGARGGTTPVLTGRGKEPELFVGMACGVAKAVVMQQNEVPILELMHIDFHHINSC